MESIWWENPLKVSPKVLQAHQNICTAQDVHLMFTNCNQNKTLMIENLVTSSQEKVAYQHREIVLLY